MRCILLLLWSISPPTPSTLLLLPRAEYQNDMTLSRIWHFEETGVAFSVPPQVIAHIKGFHELFWYLRTSMYPKLPQLTQAASLSPRPEVFALIYRAVLNQWPLIPCGCVTMTLSVIQCFWPTLCDDIVTDHQALGMTKILRNSSWNSLTLRGWKYWWV